MTSTEIEALQESLKYHMETEGSSAVKDFLDIPWITLNAHIYSEQGKVVKFYQGDKFCGVLIFDVDRGWWTPKVIVSEVAVLACLGVHGLQREACKMLDQLAKEYHASLIASGCFFQKYPKIVSNCYKKFGYVDTYPTYAKVVNHDNQRRDENPVCLQRGM